MLHIKFKSISVLAVSLAVAWAFVVLGAVLLQAAFTDSLVKPRGAKAADLSVAFTGSNFSLSRSVFYLEVSTTGKIPANGSLPVLLVSRSISVKGVEDVRPARVVGSARPDPQTVAFEVETGPPVPGGNSVEISIGMFILRTADSPSVIEGPWVYQAQLDPTTLAEGSQIVRVNQSISDNGAMVTVSEARVTQEEIFITYELTVPAGYTGPVASPARIRLPTGEVIKGRAAQSSRNLTGELALSFPPLPIGTKSFDVEFGPYLITKAGVPVAIDIPAGSSVLSGTGSLLIDKTISTPAGDITVSTLQAANARFAVEFVGTAGASFPAAISPEATIVATDNAGRTYQASNIAVQFNRDPSGTPFFATALIEFSQPLPSDVTHLDLSIDKMWRELDIPASVRVSLE